MIIINNKTNNIIGPYNGQTIAANASLTINGVILPYLYDGILLSDVMNGIVSITFAGNEVSNVNAASLLMQLSQIINTDSDGATYARTKVVPTGMTFCFRAFEFTTSTLNSVVNNDSNNNPMTDVTINFYDSSGTHLTSDLSTCTKTVVDFEPVYNYYIIGGQLRMTTPPTDNVHIHIIGVPDIPALYGGSKVMIQNLNLKYISATDKIETDGRAGKPLTYSSTQHTNKIRMIIYHPEAYTQSLMLVFEMFK